MTMRGFLTKGFIAAAVLVGGNYLLAKAGLEHIETAISIYQGGYDRAELGRRTVIYTGPTAPAATPAP